MSGAGLERGGDPRVDLMPAEVRERRRGRGIRRLLVLALVGAIVVVGAGYAAASLRAATAAAELSTAQARTSQLLAQQLEYAEVTKLESERALLLAQRARITASEVLWKRLLDAVLALLPEGASVQNLQAKSASLTNPDLGVAGPLRAARVAEVIVTIATPGDPPITAWAEALARTDLVADDLTTIVSRVGDDGAYVTTITLNAGEPALASRFPDDVSDTQGADTGTGAEGANG